MLYRRGMLSEAGYTHQSARWQGGKRQLDDDIPGVPASHRVQPFRTARGPLVPPTHADNFVTGSAEVVIYLAPRASWPSTAGVVPCRTSGHHHCARGSAIQTKFFTIYQDLYASNLLRDVQNMIPARMVGERAPAANYLCWPRRRDSARRSAAKRPRPSSS
jgi:hypothetical protein